MPRGPKVGQIFLQGLLNPGYKGRIYPINPNADEMLGLRCYPSISSLPETPDLAVLVVGSEAAIDVIGECADRGVKAAALFTAGFSEAGTDEGRQREAELLAAARRGARPVRLVGPNCMALYVPKTGLAMFPGMPSEVGPSRVRVAERLAVHVRRRRGDTRAGWRSARSSASATRRT